MLKVKTPFQLFMMKIELFKQLPIYSSNAIKFCPETDGLINDSSQKKDNFIETSVQDNGKGINPNDFDVIFDKFYQASNQNFKKPVGSGLGLAICKQIIEHHKR